METKQAIEADFTVETTQSAPLVARTSNGEIDLGTLADDALAQYLVSAFDGRREACKLYDDVISRVKLEIVTRLHDRNATEFVAPQLAECKLEPVYTEYVDDLTAARKARELLLAAGKDEEAAKVCKHIPEETVVVPAHWELGNRNSITALKKKHGTGSPIGDALAATMQRVKVDEKLSIKVAPTP